MIWYILASAILLYCFEIIGRYVLSILKIDKIKCAFGIGLIVFLAYAYITTSLLTYFNCSFYLISIIYSLFYIVLIILIIKNRKQISFRIDYINILLLIIFETIMLLYAYNTTLGELNVFDSVTYINMVTSNIKSNNMNIAYYLKSTELSVISNQYTFQSFYYISSYFTYIFANIINVFHKTYYATTYIWVFQILFNAFFCSLIINSIDIIKKGHRFFFKIFVILFFALVYGRIFYYNVSGFYGNTYRIITTGYSILILYLLTRKTENNNNGLLVLFDMALLSTAAVSSSGLYIDMFIMFGSYFILCKKYNNVLKYFGFALLFILINLFMILTNNNLLFCLPLSVFMSVIIFAFGEQINHFLSRKNVLIIIISFVFVFMLVASLLITKNLFDFSVFFHSLDDMSINYFDFEQKPYLQYLKVFVVLLLLSSLLSVRKEPIVNFSLILFACIFNPLCCSFINKILYVYMRSFDIILNPFTFILYLDLLLNFFNNNMFLRIVVYASMIIVIFENSLLKPVYCNDSFIINQQFESINNTCYNREFKMSQYEKETIDFIQDDCIFNNISNPYIVTPGLLTQGVITNGRYLYNRNETYKCPFVQNPEMQLYSIFYPERYPGDFVSGIKPDYENVESYLIDAKIDYLVVDKTKEYYDSALDIYSYLYLKIQESFAAIFENERYSVFKIS